MKKIHRFYNCKKQGHKFAILCLFISGVRKKETAIIQSVDEKGEQANVEVVYRYLAQCSVCKELATPEVPKDRLEDEKKKIGDLSNLQK